MYQIYHGEEPETAIYIRVWNTYDPEYNTDEENEFSIKAKVVYFYHSEIRSFVNTDDALSWALETLTEFKSKYEGDIPIPSTTQIKNMERVERQELAHFERRAIEFANKKAQADR